MDSYLIVKILDSNSLVSSLTEVYKDAELRSYKADSDDEIQLFKDSAKLNDYDYDSIQVYSRICTITEANDTESAITIANSIISEILDLKAINHPISRISCTNVGFIKNLNTGISSAISKDGFNLTTSYMTRYTEVNRYDFINVVQANDSELAERYIKATHWFRHAKHESNVQLKILFQWFALEALLKENDNDNIIPTVRWFLGFPNGKKQAEVSPSMMQSLRDNSDYVFWSKRIDDLLNQIRILRNKSIHEGNRQKDYADNLLDLYEKIMIYSVSRCLGAVQTAIQSRILTVSEFKDYVPVLFQYGTRQVEDVLYNIIHTFNEHRSAIQN
ncbi:HEPN domain-containing protein [Vibrio sp. McD22-P3]|uniref:HEPN domain-containing protein n=1 Tax=Vibrio sp. McD22-P3 TaxID=2724880 RepID=UPI001EEBA3AE|nr:HEPN domain-containing protein [Vibrio sp. McD22-P3]MCF4175159.1 hypothetical protein [Vibrio sp. McD22-P3]